MSKGPGGGTPPHVDAQTRLANEKLALEIAALSRTTKWEPLIRLTPLISILVTAGALAITAWQVSEERRGALETTRRESMRPILDRQVSSYFEASKVVARLAQAGARFRERPDDVRQFWEFYNGPLIMVESHGVSGAMKAFGNCLSGKDSCSEDEMQRRSRVLASEMLVSIGEDSRMTVENFAKTRFSYRRE